MVNNSHIDMRAYDRLFCLWQTPIGWAAFADTSCAREALEISRPTLDKLLKEKDF